MVNLILIAGAPGTGKTVLLNQMKREFPSFCYLELDSFKESIWDEYGFDDKEEKKSLEELAVGEFFYVAIKKSKTYKTLVLDYCFSEKHYPYIEQLLSKSPNANVLTLLLIDEDSRITYKRWITRWKEVGLRHKGHYYHQYDTESGTFSDKMKRLSLAQFRRLPVSEKYNQFHYGKTLHLLVEEKGVNSTQWKRVRSIISKF